MTAQIRGLGVNIAQERRIVAVEDLGDVCFRPPKSLCANHTNAFPLALWCGSTITPTFSCPSRNKKCDLVPDPHKNP
jgi:hypothetical protein